jgi:hypothetical protein
MDRERIGTATASPGDSLPEFLGKKIILGLSRRSLVAWRQGMNTRQTFLKIVVFLSLMLLLAGALQVPRSAWASMEDAAIFYEELDQHGDWVEYENYGPVWYPTQVQENWRPYVDGRWTPAEEGYVFETAEPWGWATYHYGNWMPTEEYGWVWVPGRTWYPNTVTWRTSPESESPDASYVGWAPVPPPNYTPPPGYYPEGYYGGGPYRGPFESLITAPFWIFVRAASFLLGFAEPYSPAYSYWGCQSLVPPPIVPYYYQRTVVVHNYYTPSYYPRGIIVAGPGYYNWGPPIPYVARVTRIKQVTINNYVRQVNIYQRRNVAPPPGVLARRTYFRNVVPPAMVEHRPLPRGVRVRDIQAARANLVRPHLVNANVVKNAPSLRAHIPKTRGTGVQSGQWRRGVPGVALPASAVMRTDQQMENYLRKIPPSQRIEPVSPRARKWQAPQPPGAAASQPAAVPQRRGSGPTPVAPGVVPSAAVPRAVPPGMRSDTQGTPQTEAPGTPGIPQETRGRQKRTPTPVAVIPQAPSPSRAGAPPEISKPGTQPQPGAWSRQQQTPPVAVIPKQPPGQGQQPRYTPGAPSPRTATPVRVQPQPQQARPQPSPQPQPKQQQQQQFRQKKKSPPDQFQGFGTGGPKMTGVQPNPRQYQPQPPRQVRPQPASQPRPQIRQQPQPQPQSQVRPQPRPQPRPQVRQQPRQLPQPQVKQQSRSQPQPQIRPQPRPQTQPQVRQQPRPQVRPQAQSRPQAQPQPRSKKQEQKQN